jgi:hypothetical protein
MVHLFPGLYDLYYASILERKLLRQTLIKESYAAASSGTSHGRAAVDALGPKNQGAAASRQGDGVSQLSIPAHSEKSLPGSCFPSGVEAGRGTDAAALSWVSKDTQKENC